MKKLVFLLFIICYSISSFSQENRIVLKSGTFKTDNYFDLNISDNDNYRMLFFNQIPNQKQKNELQKLGVEFLYYLPKNIFVVNLQKSISENQLKQYNITSANRILPSYKIDKKLQNSSFPEWCLKDDLLHIKVLFYSNVNFSRCVEKISLLSNKIESINESSKSSIVSIDPYKINSISDLSFVSYIEPIDAPAFPENKTGRTLHRSNTINTDYPTGKNNKVDGVKLLSDNTINSNKVILATGHSARDIFELLYKKEIEIQIKEFAIGVRVEHTQELIDQIQYKCEDRGEYLPPAPYSLAKQVNGRGVYSFCMCPGGIIAPCATSDGEVVTNGWSPSRRDFKTSNSGIVVELKLEDFVKYKEFGPLAGIQFQKEIEQKAWKLAGETQKVPAQRLVDFTNNKQSVDIPETSYFPGTTSTKLSDVLPEFINQNLIEGFKQFGKQMKGYLTNEAVIHAPESRTSSPVRIPRDKNTFQHPQIEGLFPCGEGAGYAGGIISAAIDGEKCAEKC